MATKKTSTIVKKIETSYDPEDLVTEDLDLEGVEEEDRATIQKLSDDLARTKAQADSLKVQIKALDASKELAKLEKAYGLLREDLYNTVDRVFGSDPGKFAKGSLSIREASIQFSAPKVELIPLAVAREDLMPWMDVEVDGHPCVSLQLDMPAVREAIAQGILVEDDLIDAGVAERRETRKGHVTVTKRK